MLRRYFFHHEHLLEHYMGSAPKSGNGTCEEKSAKKPIIFDFFFTRSVQSEDSQFHVFKKKILSSKEDALALTWTQTEQSTCELNEKEPSQV